MPGNETTQSIAELDRQIETLVAALDTPDPCGEDMRLDEDYEELQESANELVQNPQLLGEWSNIQNQAERFLGRNTKDLRLAAYLGAAYFHLEGLSGFARGVRLLFRLVDKYDRRLFPKSPDQRFIGQVRAIRWFVEEAERRFSGYQSQASDIGWHELSISLTDELARISRSTYPELQLSFSSLANTIARTRTLETPEQNSGTEKSKAKDAVEENDQSQQPASSISLGTHTAVATDDLLLQLAKMAHTLRAENDAEPRAYRMIRQAVWIEHHEAPIESKPGYCNTPIPGIAEREQLRDHLEKERWPGLLEQSEGMLMRAPFWLDLQHYTTLALQGLGKDHARATTAVRSEVLALVNRMPRLLQLRADDEIPLASPETKRWIHKMQPSRTEQIRAPKQAQEAEGEPWRSVIESLQTVDAATQLMVVRRELRNAKDRLTEAKIALFSAERLSKTPGLSALMARLGLQALREPCRKPMAVDLEQSLIELITLGGSRRDVTNEPGGNGSFHEGITLIRAHWDMESALQDFARSSS